MISTQHSGLEVLGPQCKISTRSNLRLSSYGVGCEVAFLQKVILYCFQSSLLATTIESALEVLVLYILDISSLVRGRFDFIPLYPKMSLCHSVS